MRTFKIVIGGDTADNLLMQTFCLEGGPSTLDRVADFAHFRVSPAVFFVSVEAKWQVDLCENAMLNNHGDITVTEVTGTAWKI